MKKSDGILAAVAIFSVVIYSLACRPAWHPSGKSVAFPFVDGEETSGIALYDTETGKVTRLCEGHDEGGFAFAHCLWSADGKTLLAVTPTEEDGLRVLKIDPSSGKFETIATISGLEEPADMYLPPLLAGDRYLWVGYLMKEESEESFYARIDLADGKVEEFFNSKDKVTLCFDFPRRGYFYLESVPGAEGAETEVNTIGTLNPTSGERKQLFKLPEADYGKFGFMAAEPAGKKLALLVGEDEGGFLRTLDLSGKIVKDIPLPEQLEGAGYMTWVGGSIWMGAETSREVGEETVKEAGLLRVQVATGKTRFISLGVGREDEAAALTLQPSVSPDGKRLAVAGHFLEPAEGERPTALVLFDLTAPDKPPTKIPLPAKEPAAEPAAEAPKAEKETAPEAAGETSAPQPAKDKPAEEAPAEGPAGKTQ